MSNGNIKNWEKIRSAYFESEVYYSQQDYEQRIDLMKSDKSSFYTSYHIYPNTHKLEAYLDSSFTKLSSVFYFLKNKTILLLENYPPVIKPAQREADLTSAHIPLKIANLLEKNKSIALLGIKEFPMEGSHCYEIEVITKEIKYLLYFNTQTYLLEFWNINGHPSLTRFFRL